MKSCAGPGPALPCPPCPPLLARRCAAGGAPVAGASLGLAAERLDALLWILPWLLPEGLSQVVPLWPPAVVVLPLWPWLPQPAVPERTWCFTGTLERSSVSLEGSGLWGLRASRARPTWGVCRSLPAASFHLQPCGVCEDGLLRRPSERPGWGSRGGGTPGAGLCRSVGGDTLPGTVLVGEGPGGAAFWLHPTGQPSQGDGPAGGKQLGGVGALAFALGQPCAELAEKGLKHPGK